MKRRTIAQGPRWAYGFEALLIAIVGTVIGVAVSCLATGCGASSYETHARVLTALDEVSAQTGSAIRVYRSADMERAALDAVTLGGGETEALAAADVVARHWEPVRDAHATFDRSVRVYAQSVLASQDLSLAQGLELTIASLHLYASVRELILDLAPETALPEVPSFLLTLFGSGSGASP